MKQTLRKPNEDLKIKLGSILTKYKKKIASVVEKFSKELVKMVWWYSLKFPMKLNRQYIFKFIFTYIHRLPNIFTVKLCLIWTIFF